MKKILLLFVFAIAGISLAQAQTTYYVTTSGDDINNNGLSWGTAFGTVQKALDAAVSGDEIWVAAGTYYPDEIDGTDSNDPDATFRLKSGVALYGGFVGTEAALADRPTPLALTILSGDIDKNDTNTDGNFVAETSADIQGTNAKSVVTGDGVDNTAILDGFTITAGDSRGTAFITDAGGGMFNTNSATPIVRNATFIGNVAKDGGGMFNDGSSPTVTNTIFSGNTAADDGGGMYNFASSPTVTNTTFIGNTANFNGGGMHNFISDPTITNTTFSGNTAANGGGMYNDRSDPTITITNTTFSGNTADDDGGGMYNFASSPTVTNTTFSGNSANRGGGIYHLNGTVTLQNSILWENAPQQIYNEADANNATFDITHTILQGGIGSVDLMERFGGTSIINDNGGNKSDDPQFITPVNPADAPTTAGNLRLKPTSPAINMGDNAADLDGTGAGTTTIADIATDLDGNPRIFPDAAAIVDMGAYEFSCDNLTFTNQIAYVDAAPGGDGSSWGTAFENLQDALYVACNCPGEVTEIWVAEGTYYPDEGIGQADDDRSSTFNLCPGVSLYGGFQGAGDDELSDADPAANKTILSGDIGTPGDNSDNALRVVTITDVGTNVTFDGFIVEGGNASTMGFSPSGGGIWIRAASFGVETSPTISRCVIRRNTALSQGGGIFITNASGTANVSIINCVFEENRAPLGGGLYANVNSSAGNTEVINSVFYNNTGELGGGIHVFTGEATIVNSTFFDNKLEDFPGFTPTNNITMPEGSAIHNRGAVTNIQNSIISGNETSQIANEPNIFDATLNIANSIVAGGAAGVADLPGFNINPGIPVSTINYDNATNKNVSPGFVNDTDPDGADDCWRTEDDGLALGTGSQAIDMGDDGFITEMMDITGAERFISMVDIGAYEFPCMVDGGDIAGDQTICENTAAAALASVAAGTGDGTISYRWEMSTTDCSSGFMTINGATGEMYDPGTLTQTTYFRRVTIATDGGTSCEAFSNCVTATVDENPPAATASDQTVCGSNVSDMVTLDGADPGSNTAQWSIVSGDGNGYFGGTPGTLTTNNPTDNFTGTRGVPYQLKYTIFSGNTCPDSETTIDIQFDDDPTPANAGPDQTGVSGVCGNEATLAATPATIGTGQWSITGLADGMGELTDPSDPATTFSGTPGQTYTLTWTTSNGVCFNSTDNVDIQFFATESADAGIDQNFCGLPANPVQLAAVAPGLGTGSWNIINNSGSGMISDVNNPNATYTPDASDLGKTVQLQWSVTGADPCPDTDDIVEITFANLVASVTSDPAVVCSGDMLMVNGNPMGGDGNYTHSWTGDGAAFLNMTDVATPTFSSNTPGNYVLNYKVTDNNMCMATASVTVRVSACELTISDPCACKDNATTLEDGQFDETVEIIAPSGETWSVTNATTGLFASNSPAPPMAPTAINYDFTEVSNNDGTSTYTLEGVHVDALGYSLTATNGNINRSVSNTCYYPNTMITGLDDFYCEDEEPVTLMGAVSR